MAGRKLDTAVKQLRVDLVELITVAVQNKLGEGVYDDAQAAELTKQVQRVAKFLIPAPKAKKVVEEVEEVVEVAA